MAQILPAGQLNTQALSADDLYIQIINPPSFIRGVPTDVWGAVGTASWGPLNTPVSLGNGTDAVASFGPISTASLNDPYDLATDLYLAFGQSDSEASSEGWGVRVSDGTDTYAAVTLAGVASPVPVTETVSGTITTGDTITFTATAASLPGSPVSVSASAAAGDTLATLAAKLAAAVNTNYNLVNAGVIASSAAGVVSLFAPTALSLAWTTAKSSGATETLTAGTGTAVTTGLTLQGLYTGTLGNQLSVTISAGAQANTFTATVTPVVGATEVYPNLPGAGFWTALANAINKGITTYRGPSQVVRGITANPTVGAPTTGTFTLTGGTDGRGGVNTATMIGNDTSTPKTGIYALRHLTPAVGVAWLVGVTDNAASPSIQAFGDSEGVSVLQPFPTGTSSAAAIALVSSVGVHSPSFAYVKDWIYFFDQVNNQTRLVPPTAVIGGAIACLTPEQSPGNKPVQLVVGTERNSPVIGNLPYGPGEVGQLENAGIMLITNPIPAGSEFGIRHGQTTSLNSATTPFEYWRMTSYLARSFAGTMGQFVDDQQSQSPQDPFRLQVKLMLNDFLTKLQGAGQIDSFLVSCTFSSNPAAQAGLGVNTPSSVAAHYLYALVQVTYLSSVRFFVLSLQGGTTVVTVGATLGQAVSNQ